MPKLRTLSGEEVIKTLEGFGFFIANRKGSHVKLKRITENNMKQTLTIPVHAELDKGTLKAIYSQATRYISDDDLRNHFYTE